ncbi:GLPGLI family protein [Ascidiimonas aurantiaca]|uniref:GLPGLI family protein n=1 Tax=Ascidiimonas aurantiaca TaxID=1685432 RepID=UPI0030EF5F30
MKKYLIVFILLLGSIFFGTAQNPVTNGKVTYSVDLQPFLAYVRSAPETAKYPQMVTFFGDMPGLAERMELELTFSGKQSRFRIKKGLRVGREDINMAIVVKRFVSKGIYYTDLDKKIQILRTRHGGTVYNVKSNIGNINWKLTREKKKIGDFVCYKATHQKKVLDKYYEVTAWYAPGIPLAFGPGEYAGSLPGLILELYDHVKHFRCTSITLNPEKKITVSFPNEAAITTITEEEYQQIGDGIYQSFKQ